MSEEMENKPVQSAEENGNSREGRPSVGHAGYQSDYNASARQQRPRIRTTRAYSSERGNNGEGGFRPEGFGGGLQSGSQQRPQSSYRPKYNNNYQQNGNSGYYSRYNNEEGGYQPRQQGGYQSRPQQGGYQPRPHQGGYQPRQQGGYQPRQQGGYQPRQQGGYQPRPQQGGYQPRPQQGAYRPRYNNEEGGYQPRPQQGGYRPRPYGYGNHPQQGGMRQHVPSYNLNAKYSMKKRIEYKEENFDPNEPVRLNKFLANAGICSRREADEHIQAGLVKVNGEVVTELGTKVMRTDDITYKDTPVNLEKKVYILLNKPKDCVTTSDDPQQRKTVMDIVKNVCPERIYPVGRLDRNTTGVLLLTNDGDLASKLTHPKFLKKKVYHVYLDKNVTAHDMQQIAEGITLDDGEIHADQIEYASNTDKSQVGIEIHSGKNRIVRRIFESLGYRVVKLDRVLFAGLTKKNLRRGDWRFLTEKEVEMLRMGAFE